MQSQASEKAAAGLVKPPQQDALLAPTKGQQFVLVAFCFTLGLWPFLEGATVGWKILGGFALLLGLLVLSAGFAIRASSASLGGSRGSRLSFAHIEEDYRGFSTGHPQLGLRVVAVESNPFGSATLLIQPTSPPDDPQGLMSFVKARLFTLMPTALDGVNHLRLKQHPAVCVISYRGRDFPEPSWFVSDGHVTVGPLGFRYPEWDEGKKMYQFTLMETSFTSTTAAIQMSSVAGSKASIVNEVAALYRDRVGEFSL
jgi:hypothetical protein